MSFSLTSFLPREQELPSPPNHYCTEWPARKSLLDPPTDAKATPKTAEATPTALGQGDQGDQSAIALQPLQPQPTEKLTLLSSSSVTLERSVKVMNNILKFKEAIP